MQLLDPLPSQSERPSQHLVMTALHDMTEQIQLQADFSIHHPHYKPLELPDAAIAHFQTLPPELQQRFWRSRLQSFLYGIYYNGSLRQSLALDAEQLDLNAQQNLENNTSQGVDLNFYEQLHRNNRGTGSWDAGWQISRQESDGSLAVCKDGLTLHIERSKHLLPTEQNAVVGDQVTLRLPHNRVQNGFYLAVGQAQSSEGPDETVRLYFNVTPEGAIALMQSVTQQLNQLNLPFRFKALYNPSDYDRYDAAVLYIDRRDFAAVHPAIQSIYCSTQSYFRPEIPLFTKWLAPGLGLAEEPQQRFFAQESFGTNRCYLVALGLLTAWQAGEHAPEHRLQAIRKQFSSLGIDLEQPYLNAHSRDSYWPLELC